MYVVILAGGSGTRLWPRSRRHRPKHLLDLVTERSLLQETFDRVSEVVPAASVLVVTEHSHAGLIREQLPEIPPENILVEPTRRGTGPAIGLAATRLVRQDPNAVMAVFPSDHVITRKDEFLAMLRVAEDVASTSDALLTFGIPPNAPSTEFGYVHRGKQHSFPNGQHVYHVESFTEKPDEARARQFLSSGEYFWNSGMFCWKASAILREIERFVPDLYRGLMAIDAASAGPKAQQVLRDVYASLPKDTIDYAVLEKADCVLVIPADIGWSDVGTWSALLDVLPPGKNGNVRLAATELIDIDTVNTLVYSPHRLVATIGVQDLIIIDSEDALLICSKERAGDVRQIVEQLEAEERHEHL